MKLYGHFFALAVALLFAGCTQVTLQNGKSSVAYKGAKIFSPTVLSLREGNCAVPTVDGAGIVQEPPTAAQTTAPGASGAIAASACTTSVMSVNGVDLKGLVNFVLSAVLAGIAAG